MKNHRQGGKFCDEHTTFTDLSIIAADIANQCPEVTKISAGYIQNGKGVSGGENRVKIGDYAGGVLLTVRQSRSVQEVRIVTKNIQATKLALARGLRDRKIAICFGKKSG